MKNWPAVRLRFRPSASSDSPAIQELLAAALDDFRPTAVQESESEWLVFFGNAADRHRAATALPLATPGIITVEAVDVADEDWARRSQQDLKPVIVGRITIAPPWYAGTEAGATESAHAGTEAGATGITILITPSMGFGTGHHASTRLCAALLQHVDLSGKTVLDAGTGSGILALVARALGARSVVAVDDDADAIESARENLELNGVTKGIDLRVADFRSLPGQPADVVTANLTGGLLVRGANLLGQAVAPGGTLIISGVMLEEEADVVAAFTPELTVVERLAEDEWVGVRLTRASAAR
jgi:ribosomal protein L11 methyltransferase